MATAIAAARETLEHLRVGPNGGPSHLNRAVNKLGETLRASVIRNWGVALKFERERRQMSTKELADRVGVSVADIVLWESGKGAPTGKQQPRLYGSLPLMKNYKEYLPRLAVKAAEMVEVAAARTAPPEVAMAKGPAKTEKETHWPAPAAPIPLGIRTFGQALRAARVARGLDQTVAAAKLGTTGSSLSTWERDKSAPTPPTLMALREAWPELKAPHVPVPLGYRRKNRSPHILEDETAPEAMPIEPEPAPAPPPPAPPAPVVAAVAAPPAPTPEPMDLARQYTEALSRARRMKGRSERWMAAATIADERAKQADAEAKELLKQLQERA